MKLGFSNLNYFKVRWARELLQNSVRGPKGLPSMDRGKDRVKVKGSKGL